MNADQYTPYGAGKLFGVTIERERIIKLLEADCDCGIWRDYLLGCPHEVAIALIKRENDNSVIRSTTDNAVKGTEFAYFETPFEGENK